MTVCVLMMGSRVVGGRIKAIMPFSTTPFCHSVLLSLASRKVLVHAYSIFAKLQ